MKPGSRRICAAPNTAPNASGPSSTSAPILAATSAPAITSESSSTSTKCARCMIVAAEAKDVSKRLALVLLPLVLGVTGAAGYPRHAAGCGHAHRRSGGHAVEHSGRRLRRRPRCHARRDGPRRFGRFGFRRRRLGRRHGGLFRRRRCRRGGRGVFTGIGALVGVGSAALVVAGVVAASTIIPGLAGARSRDLAPRTPGTKTRPRSRRTSVPTRR